MKAFFLAGLAASAVFGPQSAAIATPLSTGYYYGTGYLASASPSLVCGFFGITAGTTSTGIFYYPGAGKTGATLRSNYSTSKGTGVEAEVFPATPALNVTTWAGTLEEGFETGTQKAVPFTAQFTFLDSASALVSVVATLSADGATCKTTENIVLLKTGN
jgi:hypothetical protein